jgi:hypothetical protein
MKTCEQRITPQVKEEPDTYESKTIIIDGPDKPANGHTPICKRKRGTLA